eukprot:TRINITY_DN65549_c9_g1_i1.p3 TRINITY_DN65549_c9_g1~~TRINITY_DN65549_c9_g1_i1.p3  ORF type:complete len:128 (+),score=9.72 TRINITY_DN65549_c9_g1_i1:239-622(+)
MFPSHPAILLLPCSFVLSHATSISPAVGSVDTQHAHWQISIAVECCNQKRPQLEQVCALAMEFNFADVSYKDVGTLVIHYCLLLLSLWHDRCSRCSSRFMCKLEEATVSPSGGSPSVSSANIQNFTT